MRNFPSRLLLFVLGAVLPLCGQGTMAVVGTTLNAPGVVASGVGTGAGEIRSYQDAGNQLWTSLGTDPTTTNRSGLYRSSIAGYWAYFNVSTGDIGLDSMFSGANTLFQIGGVTKAELYNDGHFGFLAGYSLNQTNATGATTLTANSADVICNGGSVTLPATPNAGQAVFVTNVGLSACTVDGNGKGIGNVTSAIPTSYSLAAGQSIELQYDALSTTTAWRLLAQPSTGSSSGTVTSFSSGNLSPLFTTSVATPTTTPALTFSLSTAGAHTFLGNNTGSTAAPSYVQPAFTDLSGSVATTQLPTVPVANGGTNATTASAAVANLNSMTDPGANGLVARTAANTTAARTLQSTSGGVLSWTNGDGVSGNPTPSFILPTKLNYHTAICQGITAYAAFSLPFANTPTATCVTGTNTIYGGLTFSATNQNAQEHFKLPGDWTGAVDIDLVYRSAGTTGNIVWGVQTACVADGATGDPAFNTVQTVSTAAQGTTLQWKTASLTGLTTTGCAANNEFHFKLVLNTATTTTGNIDLIGVRFTVRRAL